MIAKVDAETDTPKPADAVNTERFFVTETELVQRLGMMDAAPGTATAASSLGLADRLANADLRRIGIQSLLVRDLATLSDGDRLDAIGKAQVVGAVLGTTTTGLILSVEGPNVRAWTVLVAGTAGNMVMALGPVGVHEVVPLDPSLPLTHPLKKLVDGYVADTAMHRPLVVRVRRARAGHDDDGIRLTIAEDGTWTMPAGSLLVHTGEEQVWAAVEAALQRP